MCLIMYQCHPYIFQKDAPQWASAASTKTPAPVTIRAAELAEMVNWWLQISTPCKRRKMSQRFGAALGQIGHMLRVALAQGCTDLLNLRYLRSRLLEM